MSEFNGYPREAFTFFEGLLENMDREWFEAHKEDYYAHVHKPTQDFVLALGNRLKTMFDGLEFDEKRSLMRIYRDIRFSKTKHLIRPIKALCCGKARARSPKKTPAFILDWWPKAWECTLVCTTSTNLC